MFGDDFNGVSACRHSSANTLGKTSELVGKGIYQFLAVGSFDQVLIFLYLACNGLCNGIVGVCGHHIRAAMFTGVSRPYSDSSRFVVLKNSYQDHRLDRLRLTTPLCRVKKYSSRSSTQLATLLRTF